MKWTNTVYGDLLARCGHLYVRIERADSFTWFVEPDDEDKSYRRALAEGYAPTVDEAKKAAEAACEQLAAAMISSLREPQGA